MGIRAAALAVMLLTTVGVRPAAAQFGLLEGLFEKFDDVSMYLTVASFTDRPANLTGGGPGEPAQRHGIYGAGVEALFRAGELGWDGPEPVRELQLDTVEVVFEEVAGETVKRTYTTVASSGVVASDDGRRGGPEMEFEFALGYAELHSFASVSPAFDIVGAVRELPSLTLYAAYRPHRSIVPYAGIRTGLAQLHGFRAYMTGDALEPAYAAEASTFQFGGLAGLAWGPGEMFTFFIEPSYVFRKFSGVDWVAHEDAVPAILPKSLNFSTAGVSFGAQVAIGRGD
jgi:hypothetical protein